MKVKLLKNLRKRYEWYFNTDGYPILLDHLTQRVTIYDIEYLCQRRNYRVEDLPTIVKCPLTEWAWRFVKFDILSYYGWSFDHVQYKKALRKLNRKKNK